VWRPGVTAAQWRSEKLGGEAFWRRRGEGRSAVICGVLRGVLGLTFIGPGEGAGGVAGVTVVMNGY
jgi:hypothetical protein